MKDKKIMMLSLCVLWLGPVSQAADDFIEQIHLVKNEDGTVVHGVTEHIYVNGPDEIGERDGIVPSAFPIGESGSILVLKGTGLGDDNKLYTLDQKLINAYLPVADINIQSVDPYEVTRTRSDEPVIVSINVEGLVSADGTPDGASKVYVERVTQNYSADINRIPVTGDVSETVVEAFYYDKNGKIEGLMNTKLDSEYDFGQRGEETYRAYALPDEDLGWTVIDEEKVQIWPVAEAELTGIVDGEIIKGDVPNVTMKLKDLYPTSLTYLQIYEGEQKLNTKGDVVPGTELSFNTIVPQNPGEIVIPASVFEGLIDKSGKYTMEILTVTPFNDGDPELVVSVTFDIDWDIIIRSAGIYTAE